MLVFYDTRFRFNESQLRDMFALQARANDVMSDAWRTSCNCTIPYYRASFMEGAEAIDHMGWKWWKKFTPNVGQMQIELIDILHFTLSHYVRESFVAYAEDGVQVDDDIVFEHAAELAVTEDSLITINPIARAASEDFYEKIETVDGGRELDLQKFEFADLMEQFLHICLTEGRPNLTYLYALFDKSGMDPAGVYNGYVCKNFLNIFRTANGQRENNYYKIWAGREDNVWMEEYVETELNNGNELSLEALEGYITTTYESLLQEGNVEKA
jgi:hypothetical protein